MVTVKAQDLSYGNAATDLSTEALTRNFQGSWKIQDADGPSVNSCIIATRIGLFAPPLGCGRDQLQTANKYFADPTSHVRIHHYPAGPPRPVRYLSYIENIPGKIAPSEVSHCSLLTNPAHG